MHSRKPVGLLRPSIIKDNSDVGEITRMSKKRVQTGSFSDYVPLLIEGFSYSCAMAPKNLLLVVVFTVSSSPDVRHCSHLRTSICHMVKPLF